MQMFKVLDTFHLDFIRILPAVQETKGGLLCKEVKLVTPRVIILPKATKCLAESELWL